MGLMHNDKHLRSNAEPAPDPRRPDADEISNATSAGDCGEPNYTTVSGIPICSRCGKSTRNQDALVCAPCRKGTRLLLTKADKRLLKGMGISR